MALKGNAALRWTPPGGTETTHELAWPLVLEPKARVRTRSWRAFGRDFSEQASVTISDATAYEYVARVRFDTEPAELLDLLEDGADGVAVDYYPDNAASTSFPFWIIDSGEVSEVEWEGERGRAEYRTTLTLRTRDGSNVSEILSGQAH